jgi:hypothetical protein
LDRVNTWQFGPDRYPAFFHPRRGPVLGEMLQQKGNPPTKGGKGQFSFDRGGLIMHDEQPNYSSTPGEIIEYYDTHLNLTLRELSDMTGRSVAYLKGLLMHPEKVKV